MRVVLRVCKLIFPTLALGVTACSSLESEGSLLGRGFIPSLSDTGQVPSDSTEVSNTPLAAQNKHTTYLQGTGNFLGDQPERISRNPDDSDGITLNLVNVPTAQAAKTILGDILVVDYTIASSVDGKIRILKEMQQPLASIRDGVARSLYTKELAERIGVDETAVMERIRAETVRERGIRSRESLKKST